MSTTYTNKQSAETSKYNVVGTRPIRHDGYDKVTGRARFGADLVMAGQLHGRILRSPHAHARILMVETAVATAAPGVLAVLTASDLRSEAFGNPAIDFFGIEGGAYRHRPGTELFMPDNALLAGDQARHVGDAIALVVAETEQQARDAAVLVEVMFEPLPAIVDTAAALSPGAPLVWEGAQGNL